MQTLTVTKARANLGHWVRRALRGDEIGLVLGAQLVALRPVPIEAGDYMEREYGLTTAEADRIAARLRAEARRNLAAGNYVALEEAFPDHAPRPARTPRPRRRRKARA